MLTNETCPHSVCSLTKAGSGCGSQALTVAGQGSTVYAAPVAGGAAVGWGPAWVAVAVVVVVADLHRG